MEGVRHRGKKKDESLSSGNVEKPHRRIHVSSWRLSVGIGILLFIFILFALMTMHLKSLPNPLKIADEASYPDRFISERAEADLKKLVDIGTKVTGSYACEVLAVKVILQEVSKIALNAKPIHLLQQDLHKSNGDFFLAFVPHGFHHLYYGIQNIAVRIGPTVPSNHSILVNCHYDTVPESPGASDNGLNCAVMLEVLRKISRQSTPLKNNIIFLFNGAEETPLQAAHGFITKHYWKKEVRVLVNLDSGGAGGREILFQATPNHPWILKAYAESVPHPSASLAAQELFESGLIPSDTDYRIFRDFGNVPGVDMAHAENGYIYHTRLDTMDYIQPGVYQHTGDNLLAFLRKLCNASELENIQNAAEPGSRHFYYDVFGLFMVIYSKTTGYFINIATVVLASFATWLVFTRHEGSGNLAVKGICRALLHAVPTPLIGILNIVGLSYFIDMFGRPLTWYSKPYLIIPLYVFPYVFIGLLCWQLFLPGDTKKGLRSVYGGFMLNSLALFLLTIMGVRMSYFLLLIILPQAIVTLACFKMSAGRQLIAFGLSSLFGVCNFMRNIAAVYMLLIPIAGRAGVTTPTELIISSLTGVVCFVVGNIAIGFLVAVKRCAAITKTLMLLQFLTIMLVCTPFGFPYSGNPESPALQRFYMFHTTQRIWSDQGNEVSSKVVILSMDRNHLSYIKKDVTELHSAKPLDCSIEPLCGFPIYNGRHIQFAHTAKWIDFEPPDIEKPAHLHKTDKKFVDKINKIWRMTFEVNAPDHFTLVFKFKSGCTLNDWTLGKERQPAIFNNTEYYVVYFTHGNVQDSIQFSLDLKISDGYSGPWFDVSLVGHYQHQRHNNSTSFGKFLKKFPSWAHVTQWVTSVDIHTF